MGLQVSAAKAEVLTQVETTAAHAAAAAGALVPLDDDDDTAVAEGGGGRGGSSSGAMARGSSGASGRVARPATARVGGGEWTKLHALAESLALNGSPPQLASILCATVSQRFSTTQVRFCGRKRRGECNGRRKRVRCGHVRLREQERRNEM